MAQSSHPDHVGECPLSGVKRTLTLAPIRRRSGMGFNRRKMEDQRRRAAEKEATGRRAADFYSNLLDAIVVSAGDDPAAPRVPAEPGRTSC